MLIYRQRELDAGEQMRQAPFIAISRCFHAISLCFHAISRCFHSLTPSIAQSANGAASASGGVGGGASGGARTVRFQQKNPDLLIRNPDFRLKTVDFLINQETGRVRLSAALLSSEGVLAERACERPRDWTAEGRC